MTMHAAVVRSFDHPPRYETHAAAEAARADRSIVEVLAAGLHPRVRTDASGRHYTSTGSLPMIPGIDGVGRLPDGQRVYFVVPDEAWGSMAERAVIDPQRVVALPDSVEATKVAAAMNPAMSSWVALRRRVPLQPGQSVLVLGATGNAGAMAVQVAKHLGAGRLVGAGRSEQGLAELARLGADQVVALSEDPVITAERVAQAAAEVDVVIDYLWGEPAISTMMAILQARTDRSRALDWVQIGAIAGPTIELPSAALRSANLKIQGNGQGAVSLEGYLAELPSLLAEIDAGAIEVNTHLVPLAEVETAWNAPTERGVRTVLIP